MRSCGQKKAPWPLEIKHAKSSKKVMQKVNEKMILRSFLIQHTVFSNTTYTVHVILHTTVAKFQDVVVCEYYFEVKNKTIVSYVLLCCNQNPYDSLFPFR